MEDSGKVKNKIITIEQIKEVAKYLEDIKEEYIKLMDEDEEKNKSLPYEKRNYKYKNNIRPKVEYNINFTNNKSVVKADYDWFLENIENNDKINIIYIYLDVSYNVDCENEKIKYKSFSIRLSIHENEFNVRTDCRDLEEEANKIYSYTKGILEGGETRYNKTIKNRNLRIQSFCFSIGFVLSYFVFIVLLFFKNKMSMDLSSLLFSKYAIIFGQYIVAGVIGNILGLPIITALYKNILPRRKSHYSSSSHKTIYTDDVDEYVDESEVQIGKNATSPQRREKIEEIFKITRIIVLIQVAISILLAIILK